MKIKWFSLFFYFIFFHLLTITFCSNENPHKIPHYATRTAYRNHAYKSSSSVLLTETESKQFLSLHKCHAVHVSTVYRHGTRYPALQHIQSINQIYDRFIQEKSTHPNLPSNFFDWKNPFDVDFERSLAEEGQKELRELANRMKQTWKIQTSFPFHVNNTRWFTSSKSRCIQSGIHFLMEFLSNEISTEKEAEDILTINDQLLRHFDFCPAYSQLVKANNNKNPNKDEVKSFENSFEIQTILQEIQKQFSFSSTNGDNFKLNVKDVKTMFIQCAHEVAVTTRSPKHSPWCCFFNETQRQIMEYFLDLKNYWVKGYGYHVNYHQSCILLNQIRLHLEEAMTMNKDLSGTFYFGHAETLIPLLSLLGLFNDSEPLLSNNYNQHLFRQFKTSSMTPFAGNLAFVLHECHSNSSANKHYRIELLLNEQPVSWSIFQDQTNVLWKDFLEHFNFCWDQQFDFQSACSVTTSASRHPRHDVHHEL